MDSVITKLIVRKLRSLYKTFSRKKVMDAIQDTPLTKVLSILDLIASGVSSILPSNIYLANKFLETSGVGPAIIISIAIAAITSIFAGLCYAELSARMPRAGSAYIYSYVSMGEFLAFLMGWILILDYAINSVTIISSLSMSIDRFYNDDILKTKDFFLLVSFNVDSLSSSDFIAFSFTLIISAVLILGTKKSSKMSNVFTFMNLSVILFVTIVSSLKADFSNWTTVSNCTEKTYKFREVGSMPCGVYMADVVLGVFRCFHIFVSFDCLATLGEEAKNPRQSIPIAIIATLIITFFVYFSFSIMLTLQPYYNQELESLLRLDTIEWKCRWLVMFKIGMISGLCANLLGSIFSLSRVIYAMASDGLIFKWMGNINSRFQTPIMGTLCATLLIGILVIISWYNPWGIDTIIICKLRTYWIVASCVIILRYEESEVYDREVDHNSRNFVFIIKQLINANKLNHSTKLTAHIVNVLVFFYVILCLCTATLLSKYVKKINDTREIEVKKAKAFVTPLVTLAAILVIILIFIHFQPVSKKRLTFSVPLIPFLPGFSIFINMFFMMLMLDTLEIWTIFFVWIAIGLGIYFLYGIRHSHI